MNSGLCEHCLRVAYLVTDMTILLGMDEKATMDVQLAAIYHDIGKTQIPEQVLNKPGKLTPGEYFIMKLHAEIGYRMIQCHTSPETAQMVLYHHEDYDGGGYYGLQGNDIPCGLLAGLLPRHDRNSANSLTKIQSSDCFCKVKVVHLIQSLWKTVVL